MIFAAMIVSAEHLFVYKDSISGGAGHVDVAVPVRGHFLRSECRQRSLALRSESQNRAPREEAHPMGEGEGFLSSFRKVEQTLQRSPASTARGIRSVAIGRSFDNGTAA